MLINEWEIWHTFASYFVSPIHNLEKTARNMVESGLLECAFIDNGNYYWQKNSEVLAGRIDITLGADRSSALLNFKSPIPDGYAGEMLFDSAYFHFAQLKQFSRARDFPPSNIRGHLGKSLLISKEYTYDVYPVVKLYSTGVILIEIRIVSPKARIGLGRFVDEHISLYKQSFDNALVPPGLRIAAQHAFFLSEKPKLLIGLRLFSYLFDRDLHRNISKNTVGQDGEDFEFQFVPLWDLDMIEKAKKDKSKNQDANFNVYTISEFAKDILHAVSISIPGLRRGKSLLLKPNTPLAVGDFFSGKSHVHLLRFQGQSLTAQQNDSKFKNELGWIMGGLYERGSKLGEQYLPRNVRMLDDYGAYIAEQGTLWVWSKKGLSRPDSKKIPHNGGLVYFNQSICEMLEYGHMLHRRMFELVGNLKKPEMALRARHELVELETAMRDVSGYLEIRDLLVQGWDAMKVGALQSAISDMIGIRQAVASMQESRNITNWQTVLSLMFGIVAIPTFSTGIIRPLWNWLDLWRPINTDAAEIMFFLIALVMIVILLFTVSFARNRHR